MISHKYKCIFIHIPKCAGTSIESALGHFDEYDGWGRQDHRTIRQIQQPIEWGKVLTSKDNFDEYIRRIQHKFRKYENSLNKLTVTQEQYQKYFKFTIVRNPWARAYSYYKGTIKKDPRYKNLPSISLEDFLNEQLGKKHLQPQMNYIKRFDGTIDLDFIGRFENLSKDFEYIAKKVGLDIHQLPHMLKGSSDDYRLHYSEEAKKLIETTYKEEIELFKYTFD